MRYEWRTKISSPFSQLENRVWLRIIRGQSERYIEAYSVITYVVARYQGTKCGW